MTKYKPLTSAIQQNAVTRQTLSLPDNAVPNALAWSPDGKRLAVASQNYGITILPEKRFIFSFDDAFYHSTTSCIRLLWSPNGRELGVLLSALDEDKGNELWRIDVSGHRHRLVDTNVNAFGWGRRLIYCKDLEISPNDTTLPEQVLYVDDPAHVVALSARTTTRYSHVRRNAVLMRVRGCYPTAVSTDGKCFLGRERNDMGILGKPVFWVCRIDPNRGKLLWRYILDIGRGAMPEHYHTDQIEWNSMYRIAAIQAAGATDGSSPYLILSSWRKHYDVSYSAEKFDSAVDSDTQWGRHYAIFVQGDDVIAYHSQTRRWITLQKLTALADDENDSVPPIDRIPLTVSHDGKQLAYLWAADANSSTSHRRCIWTIQMAQLKYQP